MSNSVVIRIAEALVADINAASWSQSFTAVRSYLPRFDLGDLATLRVTVVAIDLAREPLARSIEKGAYRIDVGVQKRLASERAAEIDPLMYLVQEITDFVYLKPLASYDAAFCVAMENKPLFDLEHMRKSRVFTSVLSFNFSCFRSLVG